MLQGGSGAASALLERTRKIAETRRPRRPLQPVCQLGESVGGKHVGDRVGRGRDELLQYAVDERRIVANSSVMTDRSIAPSEPPGASAPPRPSEDRRIAPYQVRQPPHDRQAQPGAAITPRRRVVSL